MADLAKLTADMGAVRDGEWIAVRTPHGDTFDIRTRGFTTGYRDGLNGLRRQAARMMNMNLRPGDQQYTPETLPPSIDDQCQGQALAEYCVLDVRGLTSGGAPVPADDFRALLREPEGRTLLLGLAINAASRVGVTRAEEAKVAEGN